MTTSTFTVANNSLAVDAAIRKPVTERVCYRIEGVRGLRLDAHPSGTRTWVARYELGTGDKRRERTMKLGSAKTSKASKDDTGLKLGEACDRTADIRKGARSDIDPLAIKQERRDADTFESLGKHWLSFKTREGKAKRYIADSKAKLSRLPEWFKLKRANEIVRGDVVSYLETLAKTGKEADTNRTQAFISSVFGLAVAEGMLEINIALGIKKRFKEKQRDRWFADHEVKIIWDGIESLPAADYTKIAIKLCFIMGQRPKELCELRQAGLALDAPVPTMTIGKASAKNRSEAKLPLPKLAVDLLRQALVIAGKSEFVFPSPTGKRAVDPHSLSTAILRGRADDLSLFGIQDAELYDTKTTVATYLGNLGYINAQIAVLLNHKSANSGTVTGQHYNFGEAMSLKSEMIERWARHLEEVIGLREAAPNVVTFARKVEAV